MTDTPSDNRPPRFVRLAALLDEIGDHPTPDFTLMMLRIDGKPEYAAWCARAAWRMLEPPAIPGASLAIQAYDPDALLSATAREVRLRSAGAAAVQCTMHFGPLWRMCVEAPPISALRSMASLFPEFIDVILFLMDQLTDHELSGSPGPLRIPPILLCGPAGVGKSRFVVAVAQALGVTGVVFPMERMTAPMLRGWPPLSAPEGEPGWPVVLFLAGSPDAVYLLEDLDKYPKDWRGDWIEALRLMLDHEAAAHFTDQAVQVAVDLSAIRWVATCQDTAGVPPELLSRFEVFRIDPPVSGDRP